MPSCNVLINGVTYIRSGDAARVMDLTPDYVSHLARHGATVGEPSAASGSSTSCFPRRAICQFFDRHSATVRFCGGASWPRRSRHHGPTSLTRLVHSPQHTQHDLLSGLMKNSAPFDRHQCVRRGCAPRANDDPARTRRVREDPWRQMRGYDASIERSRTDKPA